MLGGHIVNCFIRGMHNFFWPNNPDNYYIVYDNDNFQKCVLELVRSSLDAGRP